MGLVFLGYKSGRFVTRKSAIAGLASYLRKHEPDIVGLCEVFRKNERRKLLQELGNIYPHFAEGPSRGWLIHSGLLLLSKFPFEKPQTIIFKNRQHIDRFTAKGILNTHLILENGGQLNIYFTHLQDPDSGGIETCRAITQKQVAELSSFVEKSEPPNAPTLIMGDLNTDAFDRKKATLPFAANSYENMMCALPGFTDLWLENGAQNQTGITYDAESRFHQKEPLPFDAEVRGQKGMRLDYFLLKTNQQKVWPQTTKVVTIEAHPGREISDHYGLETKIKI